MVVVDVVNAVVLGIVVVLFVMFVVAVFQVNARTKKLLGICQDILARTGKDNTES